MILAILMTAAALAAETAPSAGVPAAPHAAASANAPGAPNEKLVCRKGVNQTGSRMKMRPICLTRREWDERARHDRELMDAIQRGGATNTREPGAPQ